jgi:hypothetical protein
MGESQHPDPESGIRDEQPGSYFFELRNHFFAFLGVKILKFFDEDPGSGIQDGDSSDPGFGKKSDPESGINIPDPQHCILHHLLQGSKNKLNMDNFLPRFQKQVKKGPLSFRVSKTS